MNFNKNIKFFFIQGMLMRGHLYRADRLFKNILKNLFVILKIKGLNIVETAVNNSRIYFLFKRFHKGGTVYFIPAVVTNGSEDRNAVKCLLKHSKKRGQSILVNLMAEIIAAKDLQGETIKYKNEFHLKVIKGIPYVRFLKRKKIKKKN